MLKNPSDPLQSQPDFVEANRPRHEPLEQLEALKNAPPEELYDQLQELGPLKAQLADNVYQPRTLMEMYGVDIGRIHQDVLERPDHYTEEQKQLVDNLYFGRPMPVEPRREELDDLFLTWTEKTELTAKRREVLERVTAPKDIADLAELEGDSKEKGKKPTFEDQNYDNLIKII